jgi:hypothetical protein
VKKFVLSYQNMLFVLGKKKLCPFVSFSPFAVSSLFTMHTRLYFLAHWMHACMHDHHWWAHGGICRPNPQWGHRGSSRCCFMAAFVPHAACLALRVGNGAIMRCMHAHVLPRARERESLGEVSCMHACLGACWARALLVGLGCPSCKKDRKPHKGKPGSKSEERERDGDGNTTIRLQAMDHYSKLINIRRPPYLRRRPTRPSEISLCPTATKGPRK